jgi:hypothetical protein
VFEGFLFGGILGGEISSSSASSVLFHATNAVGSSC